MSAASPPSRPPFITLQALHNLEKGANVFIPVVVDGSFLDQPATFVRRQDVGLIVQVNEPLLHPVTAEPFYEVGEQVGVNWKVVRQAVLA